MKPSPIRTLVFLSLLTALSGLGRAHAQITPSPTNTPIGTWYTATPVNTPTITPTFGPTPCLNWAVTMASTIPDVMRTDNSGNVYILTVGSTSSDATFLLLKYGPNGNLLWSVNYDPGLGGLSVTPEDLVISGSGQIYLTGLEYISTFNRIRLLEYDSNGNLLANVVNGGTYPETCGSLALDTAGSLYVAGSIQQGASADDMVLKYDSNLNLQWTRTRDFSGAQDQLRGIAVDASGNYYVCGYSMLNGVQTDRIIKYDASGNQQWITTANPDTPSRIQLDPSGNLYVAPNMAGGWIAKYDSSGNQLWLQNPGSGYYGDMAVDPSGSGVYLAGGDSSDNAEAVFYSAIGNPLWSVFFNVSSVQNQGRSVALDGSGHLYLSANSYVGAAQNLYLLKYNLGCSGVTPLPTGTPSNTPTNTPTTDPGTVTASWTASSTPTNSPTGTAPSGTVTVTSTVTNTPTNTSSSTPTFGIDPTITGTFTFTPTPCVTNTSTSTPTSTFTSTPTTDPGTATPSWTASSTATNTPTTDPGTATTTWTVSNTPTHTAIFTSTPTPTYTGGIVPPTSTATSTLTETIPSGTVTLTSTATNTPTWTVSNTPTHTSTSSWTPSATYTGSVPPTSTATNTPTNCGPGTGLNLTWSSTSPMPVSFYNGATGTLNNVLYIVGGWDGGYTNSVETYDTSTASWSFAPSMPTARNGLGVGVINGTLYAVGGYNGSTVLNTLEAYTPGSGWATLAPMPMARAQFSVGVINGLLYAVGGTNASAVVNTVEAYDPSTNTWTSKAPLLTGRKDSAVAVANGILYAIGGNSTSGCISSVEAYDPALDSWTTKASLPSPRTAFSAVGVNGLIYAAGGFNSDLGGNPFNTVLAYDPSADSWSQKYSMATGRQYFGMGAINGVLYAAGGEVNQAGFFTNTGESAAISCKPNSPTPTITFTPTVTLTPSGPTATSTPTNTPTNTVLVPTPACAGATVMGFTTAQNFYGLSGATAAYVQVLAPASGAVSTLHLFANDYGVTFVVGIYSDNGGQPGALLASSNYATSYVPGVVWNTIPLNASVNVTAGNNYWLAVWGFINQAIGGGIGGTYLTQGGSNLPASYSGSGTINSGSLDLIADICQANFPTWTPSGTPTSTYTATPSPTGTWYTATPTNTFTPTPTSAGCDSVYFSLSPAANPWTAGSTAILDGSFGPLPGTCAGATYSLNQMNLIFSTTGNLDTQIQQVQLWQGATLLGSAPYSNSITFMGFSLPSGTNAFQLDCVLSSSATGTVLATLTSAFGSGTYGFTFAGGGPNGPASGSLTVAGPTSPTNSPTLTPTSTPTHTATNSYTPTPTPTGTWYTSTPTNTPTNTPTGTETFTPTWTPSGITTPLSTFTPTNTSTPTSTATLPVSVTYTPTSTPGIDPTPTTDPGTFTMTPTPTASSTPTNSPTFSVDPTAFTTATPTDTPTITLTFTPTYTATQAVTFTPAATPIQTVIQYVSNSLPALVTLPGGVTVSMGANTLAQSTTMTIAQYPSSAAPNTGALQVLFMPTAYFINTNGLEPQAGMSVTITLPYDPAALPAGYSVSDLTVSYFDGTQWVVLPVTLDTVNHTVTVVTHHFSWWAVVMTKHTPTPVPTGLRGTDHPVLYPNPANGPLVKLYLPGGSGSFDVRVQVYTPSYRKVRDVTFPNVTAGSAVTLDLLDKEGVSLSNGLYYLVVTTPQGRSTLKLLVLR